MLIIIGIVIFFIIVGSANAAIEEQRAYQNINKLTKELEKERKKNKK